MKTRDKREGKIVLLISLDDSRAYLKSIIIYIKNSVPVVVKIEGRVYEYQGQLLHLKKALVGKLNLYML